MPALLSVASSRTASASWGNCCSRLLLIALSICACGTAWLFAPVAPWVAASWVWVTTTISRASVPASLPASVESLVKSANGEVLRPSWAWSAAPASALVPPLVST